MKEGLHISSILSAQQIYKQCRTIRNSNTMLHCFQQLRCLMTSFLGLQDHKLLSGKFCLSSNKHSPNNTPTKLLETILQAVSDVASSNTLSTSINFPVQMPLSGNKAPPSLFLQGTGLRANNPLPPDTLLPAGGQAAQSSSGHGAVGSLELHCNPAHTQGAVYCNRLS